MKGGRRETPSRELRRKKKPNKKGSRNKVFEGGHCHHRRAKRDPEGKCGVISKEVVKGEGVSSRAGRHDKTMAKATSGPASERKSLRDRRDGARLETKEKKKKMLKLQKIIPAALFA